MNLTLLRVLGLLTLTACVFPVQKFEPGSVLEQKANPPLALSREVLHEQTHRHKVLVAILDSGVDYNHPGLSQSIRLNKSGTGVGLDLLGNDSTPYPIIIDPADGEELEDILSQNSHGTHVASLATLGGHGAQGLIGLVPVRVLPLDSEGLPETHRQEDLERHVALKTSRAFSEAMEFANAEGVRVANFSLGINANEIEDEEARDLFLMKMKTDLYPKLKTDWSHILFVFAAGNESIDVTDGYFPAAFKGANMLTVGALKTKNVIASYSNRGPLVDVYIRGSDINGLIPEGKRDRMSGTSMAAPLVTNLAAKVLLKAPCLKAAEVKDLILTGTDEEVLTVEGSKESHIVKVINFTKTLSLAQLRNCPQAPAFMGSR